MSPFRYRDDEPSSTGTVVGAVVGAITGFALGMLVAQRIGGLDGLTARIRRVGRGDDDSLTVHAHVHSYASLCVADGPVFCAAAAGSFISTLRAVLCSISML